MKALHPLSRCTFIAYERYEAASRVLRLTSYANWYRSLGYRVVIEPILFNTSDSRTLRGTGLYAIRRIFREAVVGDFFGRGVILVVRQESGSMPVLMGSLNKSVKAAESSKG